MIVAVLLATSVAQMPPAPRFNPEICANVQRTGPGYIVMKETWVLPRLKLTAGQRRPRGHERRGPPADQFDRKDLRSTCQL